MLSPPNKNPPAVAAAEGLTSSDSGRGLIDKDMVPDQYRQRRFRAQRVIAKTLRMHAKKNSPTRYPGDVWRVVDCLWCRIGTVQVYRSAQHNRAHYKGLQTCGSVWTCPCCASKIEERRRKEVQTVFDWAASKGLDSSMLTNTFPHGMGDDLKELFAGQARALKLFRDDRTYRREMKAIGNVGLIRTLEITHGASGWHPHTHEVKFHREELTQEDANWIRHKLVEPWRNACIKAGLLTNETEELAFYRHALDMKAGFTAGDYLQKTDSEKTWTPAHEISKASSKAGRRSGKHPFALAVDGVPGFSELLVEYAQATKGKRKLYFSPGLKAKAGVDELTDEQIAQLDEDRAVRIANVNSAWSFIQRTDADHNTRARVLEAAEENGRDGISDLLWNLGFDPYSTSFAED